MNYGQRFVTLYRREGSRPSPRKRNAKRQNGCLRRPYNSCEKKKSEGQRITEFCQENALVIANNLFQQHKRRFDTWTSPMVNTEIRLITFFAAKLEKLCTVSKNKTRS